MKTQGLGHIPADFPDGAFIVDDHQVQQVRAFDLGEIRDGCDSSRHCGSPLFAIKFSGTKRDSSSSRGSRMITRVPRPGALCRVTVPPCCSTIWCTVLSPNPLPCRFVVKNSSKTRERVSSSMPTPVSVTVSSMQGASLGLSLGAAGSNSTPFRVCKVIRPPLGMASRDLSTRLRMICWAWPGSICTWPRLSERSEEHTSELQSLAYLVCRLLLEKK